MSGSLCVGGVSDLTPSSRESEWAGRQRVMSGGRTMRVVLTGATGFLGRNLLFEIVKRNLHALERLEVVALGRNRCGRSLQERMRDIFFRDGSAYIGLTEARGGPLRGFWENNVRCIEMDLEQENLGLTDRALQSLRAGPIAV